MAALLIEEPIKYCRKTRHDGIGINAKKLSGLSKSPFWNALAVNNKFIKTFIDGIKLSAKNILFQDCLSLICFH